MISQRISDDISPQIKIFNKVIPILMYFFSFRDFIILSLCLIGAEYGPYFQYQNIYFLNKKIGGGGERTFPNKKVHLYFYLQATCIVT